jgi:hypothetical protein
LRASTAGSLRDIGARDWTICAEAEGHNPFISYAFLSALEDSGSASAKAGWMTQHVMLRDDDGSLRGVVPCYLKYHSQGEYVFDHGWAEAMRRAGGSYYPKLQVSVPFTPVTGPRLLTPDAGVKPLLFDALVKLCGKANASSVHITFLPERESEIADEDLWLRRHDIQFHWSNQGYGTFEDFLSTLSSAKRKNIRKERQAVHDAGVSFLHLTGSDLREWHWDAFFAFYMETGSRKWGQPYLNRRFFSLLSERMADRIMLVLALRGHDVIAGALNLMDDEALYGRNWGATVQLPFLHFETCYYQAIDYAISTGRSRVEAGAQGEHKLARGYLPVKTHSLHHLVDPRLERAVREFLEHERRAVEHDNRELAAHGPYRRDGRQGEQDGI